MLKDGRDCVLARIVIGVLLLGFPASTLGALTFFSDRSAFEAGRTDLIVETFNAGRVVSGLGFAGPLDETTDNAYFSPGDIVPGVRFSNGHPTFVPLLDVVQGSPFRPVFGKALFNSSEGGVPRENPIVIESLGGSSAVGFDAYNLNSSGSVFATDTEVSVFGGSGLLGTMGFVTSSGGPVFFGVVSDAEPITRVEMVGRHRSFLIQEGIDNVSFAPAVVDAIPEPVTGGLAVTVLCAMGVAVTRRQVQIA